MHRLIRFSFYILLTGVLVIADQYSKLWIQQQFYYREIKSLFSWLNITLVYNQGAAFGFLNNASGWQQWLFSGLAIIVIVAIVLWLYQKAGKFNAFNLGLSAVLAGALGNLIDRSVYGHVVDFIDVHVNTWHWPTFNFADIFICSGALLLICTELRRSKNAL